MIFLYILLVWSGLAYLFAVIAWPHIAEHMELLNKDLEWAQHEATITPQEERHGNP